MQRIGPWHPPRGQAPHAAKLVSNPRLMLRRRLHLRVPGFRPGAAHRPLVINIQAVTGRRSDTYHSTLWGGSEGVAEPARRAHQTERLSRRYNRSRRVTTVTANVGR